jgi:hypothetical protein
MSKITAALVLVVLTLAAMSANASADASTPSVWTDATGDSASAPDISKLTMTPGAGTVAVDLTFSGALDSESRFVFLLDADRNAGTGSNGFDYAVVASQPGAVFLKWNGTAWDSPTISPQPLGEALTATDVTFTLTLGDVGGGSTFDFVAGGVHGDDIDSIPDNGLATFPAAAETATHVTIKSVLLPGTVLFPKVGNVLRIGRLQVGLTDDTVVAATSQTCTLAYKGKKLRALAGGCAWKIPVTYKKKHLVLTIRVGYDGETQVVTFPIVPS